MLRLTILNNISGLKCTHLFNDADFRSVNPEPFVILDSAQVMLPTGRSDLFVVHRQKIASGGIFTWIGLYRAVPNAVVNRTGDYYGAGLWLLNKSVAGDDVVDILGESMDALAQWMRSNGRSASDFSRIALQSLTRDTDDSDLRDLDIGREIGRETICVDASEQPDAARLAIYIDAIQNDPDGRFDRFARIMLSNDAAVLKAVGVGGRVPVRRFAEIARPAPTARTPRGSGGRIGLLSAPDPIEPPSGSRSLGPDGASELGRLRSDVRRAETQIEKLSKALAVSTARPAEQRTTVSWPLLATIVLATLGLAVGYLWVAFVVAPSLENEFADKLQKSEAGLQAQIKKLQGQITASKGDADPPAAAGSGVASGPDQPPLSAGGDASGAGARSQSRRQPVQTISQDKFEAALSQGSIVSGGVTMRVIVVAVDAPPEERLRPGVVACPSARTDKSGKPQRCSLDDLKQVWSRDTALIFYGNESGTHSIAADLASKLAGQSNVFWFQG